jgi:ketosteroid isomerase-like protein
MSQDHVEIMRRYIESGRGRGSGAEVQSKRTAHVWTLRDGKAIRLDLYNDRADAFEAVGLAG